MFELDWHLISRTADHRYKNNVMSWNGTCIDLVFLHSFIAGCFIR